MSTTVVDNKSVARCHQTCCNLCVFTWLTLCSLSNLNQVSIIQGVGWIKEKKQESNSTWIVSWCKSCPRNWLAVGRTRWYSEYLQQMLSLGGRGCKVALYSFLRTNSLNINYFKVEQVDEERWQKFKTGVHYTQEVQPMFCGIMVLKISIELPLKEW